MSEQRRPPSAAGPPDPPPPASKAPGSRRKAAKPPPDLDDLRRQLADRDRRLAELTEQSLQILDRLAAARDELQQRHADRGRVEELQQALQQARQRLRVAGRAVLGPEAATTAFEVVVWGLDAAAAAAAGELLAAAPAAPCTLLLRPHTPAAPFALAHRGPLAVLETGCQAPAAFWNHGMSATQAEVVVFLTSDVRPNEAALASLAAVAAAEGVAIASPALRSGRQRLLGRVERGVLELAPQRLREGEGIEAVGSASPEAFAIARCAFERLGPFDQDLRGDLALAEWCLRAGARSLRCVGVREAQFELGAVREPAPAIDAADRIVVLARHRPAQLAAGLLVSDTLWQQPPAELANVLRAAYRRLPLADLPAGVELLVAQTQTIADFAQAHAELVGRLVALAVSLGVPEGGAAPELAERVRTAALARNVQVETLQREVERRTELERALQGQVQGRDAAIGELRQEIQTRGKAIELLQQELLARGKAIEVLQQETQSRGKAIEALQQETQSRGKAIESLQQDLQSRGESIAALQQEAQSLRAAAAAQQQDLAAKGEELAAAQRQLQQQGAAVAALELELQANRDAIREVERKQAEREGMIGELQQEVGRRRTELEHAREQFSGALRDVTGLVGIREASSQRIADLERELAAATKRFDLAVADMNAARSGQEELRQDHGTLQEQYVELAARAQDLVRTLGERERWIAVLLQEVQQRRLFPRPLQQHERDFLAKQGVPERP